MTPSPKTSLKRTDASIGRVVLVASVCSAIVSAAVSWAVARSFLPVAKSAVTTANHTADPAPRLATPVSVQEANLPSENDAVGGSHIQLPSDTMGKGDVSRTAAYTFDMIGALKAQYDTNPYFSNRDTLKRLFDVAFANARQLENVIGRGATPEAVETEVRRLDGTLGRAIERLDYLLQSDSEKDRNDADATRLLKAKLEEIRASLSPR
jgi:hypothetical protein